MQIAMLGLGRMGANMAQRLLRGGHKVVVYGVDPRRATELAAHGATPATTLDEVVAALQPPRVVWMMVPAGRITEELTTSLAAKLSRGDLIIDGGNSNFKDSMRRAHELQQRGLFFMDAGTSGGVWGLKNGYCLMVGGSPESFRVGLRADSVPEPCALVVFGASGDLAHRKLIPALYNLALTAHLPAAFGVVGVSKSEYTHEEYREDLREAVGRFSRTKPLDEDVWRDFAGGLRYVPGAFDDDSTFQRLAGTLEELDRVRATRGNRLFYFATPPSTFPVLLRQLQKHGMIRPPGEARFTRVVIEKPFGRDLASARALNRMVLETMDERQIFRIDHYLGKETVQNLLVFRFGNTIFEPIWNRNYVDHVQITAAEELGIEGRGRYYEEAGILRDMIQNHVLQLVCLTAMEAPAAFDADAVRDEKVKVLRAISPIEGPEAVAQRIVLGQYAAGQIFGNDVPGYQEEKDVAKGSRTPTFAAIKLNIDSWRWDGVPFYLRSGNFMDTALTEIAIQFRKLPHALFGEGAAAPTR